VDVAYTVCICMREAFAQRRIISGIFIEFANNPHLIGCAAGEFCAAFEMDG